MSSGFWAGAVPPWAYAVGVCLILGALLLGMWVGFGRGEKAADMEEERLLREQAKARRTHPVYRLPGGGTVDPWHIAPPEVAHDWCPDKMVLNPTAAITTGEIQAITDEMDAWLAQHVYAAPKDYGQWLEQVDGHGLRDG